MTESSYQARGLESWAPAISATLALALGALFVWGGDDFCLDDAWIHLSYAKSVLLGDGLSYNPGDWETGFSSPLWLLCLVVWPTGLDPIPSVKLLGVLFHALSAWLACKLALELGHRRATIERPAPLASLGLVAGVLVATQSSALRGATSGMEVSLCACLCLGLTLAAAHQRWPLAVILSALAVWARPEALAYVGCVGVGAAWASRKRTALAMPLGGGIAMGLWMGYCTVVSGYPLPNTFYVKAAGQGSESGGDSWSYLLYEVWGQEAWLLSLGGITLIAAALIREARQGRKLAIVLFAAYLISCLAIALSRPLHPGVLFFEARYFFILSGVPLVIAALGITDLPRPLAALSLFALVGVNGYVASQAHDNMRAQERSVRLLHTEPANALAQHTAPPARVLVEGAGATRYFAPRNMLIIDALGLNLAAVAHAPTDAAKVCALLRLHPTHALLPDHIAQALAGVFVWTPIDSYIDPDNAMVRVRHPARVQLYRVDGLAPAWSTRCAPAPPAAASPPRL